MALASIPIRIKMNITCYYTALKKTVRQWKKFTKTALIHIGAVLNSPRTMKFRLDFLDFRRVRTFRAFADFELNLVSFLQIIELNTDEFIRMEEEVLVATFLGDETKPSICQSFDCS